MPYAFAYIQANGFTVREDATWSDRGAAIALAVTERLTKGLAVIGVANAEACTLVWRSDGGTLALPFLGRSNSAAPPKP